MSILRIYIELNLQPSSDACMAYVATDSYSYAIESTLLLAINFGM